MTTVTCETMHRDKPGFMPHEKRSNCKAWVVAEGTFSNAARGLHGRPRLEAAMRDVIHDLDRAELERRALAWFLSAHDLKHAKDPR